MSDMKNSVFRHNGQEFIVTQDMKDAYNTNGYIVIRNLLSVIEMQKARSGVEMSVGIQKYAHGRSDGNKMKSRQTLWNQPGKDITGVLVRIQRIAGTMEELIGQGEIYHYHSKLMMKDAYEGGAHVWHQDYGYWYNNGCIFSDMGSCFLPLDECKRENSCLQVLAGSHRLGRIDHITIGDQLGADPERVDKVRKLFPHVYVEMCPGDALFFHCNLLHTSDQNTSSSRRWVLIASYNTRANNPYKVHHHAQYTPMSKLPDTALLQCELIDDIPAKAYMDPSEDKSASYGKGIH
ncbi:hypothetical protein SK128_011143 [Halocaridina rubra]|uniref:Phytanoyl-CoA dioxygenase n=1 Tax=Halocaridina rubra TaxID=373956 RepID=A0AAN8X738_HALRR